MKLLVIVLCLLAERFIVHAVSHNRFHWFSIYVDAVEKHLSKISFLSSPIRMALIILPIVVVVFCTLAHFSTQLYGFVDFFLNVIILYGCLGPGNPFYPASTQSIEVSTNREEIGNYLVKVNEQMYAVLFWYLILGALGALGYRLISQCRNQKSLQATASWLTDILNWAPARMTVLFYLLVGNFQVGIKDFSKLFFKPPTNNETLLSVCGMRALDAGSTEPVMMSQAENLVEHAAILLLVLLAFFTMVAWM